MKGIALFLSKDLKNISCHSLLFGKASLLASFRLPQYLIEYFGGWKADSKTKPLYTKPNSSSLAIASACFGELKADGEMETSLQEFQRPTGCVEVESSTRIRIVLVVHTLLIFVNI